MSAHKIPQIGLHYRITMHRKGESPFLECANGLITLADELSYYFVQPTSTDRSMGWEGYYCSHNWHREFELIEEQIVPHLGLKVAESIFGKLLQFDLINLSEKDGFIYALTKLKYGCDIIRLANHRFFNDHRGWRIEIEQGRAVSQYKVQGANRLLNAMSSALLPAIK